MADCKKRIEKGEWSLAHLGGALESLLTQDTKSTLRQLFEPSQAAVVDSANPVLSYLKNDAASIMGRRPHWERGVPGFSTMPSRLRDRSKWFREALPVLCCCCRMCEAEFPNSKALSKHIDMLHGTERW